MLIASCSKSHSDKSNANAVTTSFNLGHLIVDIDGIPAVFDSIRQCGYYKRLPLPNDTYEIVINAFRNNDTSGSNINLMIIGSDTSLSGNYIDSVGNIDTKYGFLLGYTPPNFPSGFPVMNRAT